MRRTTPTDAGSAGVAGTGTECVREIPSGLPAARPDAPLGSNATTPTGGTGRRSCGEAIDVRRPPGVSMPGGGKSQATGSSLDGRARDHPDGRPGVTNEPSARPETPGRERSPDDGPGPGTDPTRTAPDGRPFERETPRILTDGGRTIEGESANGHEPPADEQGYRSLFLDVAGTEELVDEQEEQDVSRDVDEDTASLSSYVTSVAKEDGLVDTIDEPESGPAD